MGSGTVQAVNWYQPSKALERRDAGAVRDRHGSGTWRLERWLSKGDKLNLDMNTVNQYIHQAGGKVLRTVRGQG